MVEKLKIRTLGVRIPHELDLIGIVLYIIRESFPAQR